MKKILRYLETGGYHVDLIVIRRPFSMNENSVTKNLAIALPLLPSPPHLRYLTTINTPFTLLMYHYPYPQNSPHSYCFTITTTTTISLRYRKRNALKNAMIEEGLQFMTLQLALVDRSTKVDMLRTTSFSLAFF